MDANYYINKSKIFQAKAKFQTKIVISSQTGSDPQADVFSKSNFLVKTRSLLWRTLLEFDKDHW